METSYPITRSSRFSSASALLFCLVVLSAAAPAAPKTYFVSPAGSDSADGSERSPFGTIPKAVSAASGEKGAVIRLLSGTYRLHEPIELGAEASGLTIRADIPGRAVISGAQPVSGWRKDPKDKRLLVAPVPFDLGSERRFRTLVVGTNVCRIAAYPGYGNAERGFLRTTAKYAASLKIGGGGFEPPPTFAESVTLPIDRKQAPRGFDLAKMDLKNAWVDLWHMWSDSPCEIASNDLAKGILYLKQVPVWPVGMMNDRFELINVKEGLLDPGNWTLDATAREITYYLRKGETAQTLEAALSDAEQLLVIKNAANVTVDGIVFEGCSAPFKNPSFGGGLLKGAVEVSGASDITLRNVTVRFVAGAGMRVRGERIRVCDCDIGYTGSQALSIGGSDGEVSGCRLHDCGESTHAASLFGIGGTGMSVIGNTLWNSPYCGVIMSGERHLYASNDVSRVMRVLQDGGALYGGYAYCTIRDNFHHDMMEKCFKGYGQSAYYADEGSHDNLITGNRSEGVETAVHNHITRNNVISNNVFSSPTKLHISFAGSVNGTFTDNDCYFVDGFSYGREASELGTWERNRLFRGKRAGLPLKTYAKTGDGDWKLEPLPPMKPYVAVETARPPKLDGVLERKEWHSPMIRLERDEFGCGLGGNPTCFRALYDKTYLYLLVETSYYTNMGEQPSVGGRWGRSDGVRFDIGKNLSVTLMSDGTVLSSDKSFVPKEGDDYVISLQNRTGIYALRIPFSALGRSNRPSELPFNLTSYIAQHDEYRHWDTPSIANPVPGILFLGQEAAKDGARNVRDRKVR